MLMLLKRTINSLDLNNLLRHTVHLKPHTGGNTHGPHFRGGKSGVRVGRGRGKGGEDGVVVRVKKGKELDTSRSGDIFTPPAAS